jgi:hypothetical protein
MIQIFEWRLNLKNRNLPKEFIMISYRITPTHEKKTPLLKDFGVLLLFGTKLDK